MIRIYTFTIEPPADVDPQVAGPLMTKQLDRMAAHSKELLEAEVELLDDGRLMMRMMFQGRDLWYIQKRIKYPLVAALLKGKMSMKHVKSTQVSAPPSGRDRPAPRIPPPPPPGTWLPIER
jgi:hypothetical protein